jgi:16S rRNA G527 N7-methylase RsmG
MTVDQRLEFLLQSTESLHATVQQMTGQIHEHSKQLELDAANIRSLANIPLPTKPASKTSKAETRLNRRRSAPTSSWRRAARSAVGWPGTRVGNGAIIKMYLHLA